MDNFAARRYGAGVGKEQQGMADDESDEKPEDLVTTVEAARLVGASRQAILKAVGRKEIPVVRKRARSNLLDRQRVMEWGAASKRLAATRRPRRRRPGFCDADSAYAALLDPDRRNRGIRNATLPPGVADQLAKAVLTDKVIGAYRALVARDLAVREGVIALQEARLQAERDRVAAERRGAARERDAAERANNERQIREKLRRGLSRDGWTDELLKGLEEPTAHVLDALGDDAIAAEARHGSVVAEAFAEVWPRVRKWTRDEKLQMPDDAKRVRAELGKRWLLGVQRRLAGRPAPGDGPAGEA
jgi:hypothetical protein